MHAVSPLPPPEFPFLSEHCRGQRTALEADGIGWAMWDYRDGFEVVTKQDGQPAQVVESAAKALGLSGRL